MCISTSRNIHTSRDFGMFSSQKKCCTSSLTWSNKSILAAKECQPDILSATWVLSLVRSEKESVYTTSAFLWGWAELIVYFESLYTFLNNYTWKSWVKSVSSERRLVYIDFNYLSGISKEIFYAYISLIIRNIFLAIFLFLLYNSVCFYY